jgi:hypothetical protein
MALGSTQPLTEVSSTNLPGIRGGRLVRLTISPPSVSQKMSQPRRLKTLWASTARYKDNLTLLFTYQNTLCHNSENCSLLPHPSHMPIFVSNMHELRRNKWGVAGLTTTTPSSPELCTVAPNHCPDFRSICRPSELLLFPGRRITYTCNKCAAEDQSGIHPLFAHVSNIFQELKT